MKLKKLKDADIAYKTVLLRVDYNVPIENGKVLDDTRIKESLPTLRYLLQEKAKIIIMSHLGRPKAQEEEFSLTPVANHLTKLLNIPVIMTDSCIGESPKKGLEALKNGQVMMLENTRFHKEEKENDENFAKEIAAYADIYVSDAFGTAHRKHASTYGVAKFLDSYAGFLIEKEIDALSPLLEQPEGPLVLVMGGAKIDTKIGVIDNFLQKTDSILLGGGLANTFLKAKGFDIGKSLCEENKIELAQEIMLESENTACDFILPEDVIVADEISENAITADAEITGIEGEMKILDIGEKTIKKYESIISEANTVIWNGPVGLFENPLFANGTKKIAEAISSSKAKSYLGGGDTLDAIKRFGTPKESFTHISTGGGAMLEFLEGKTLPGLEVLI